MSLCPNDLLTLICVFLGAPLQFLKKELPLQKPQQWKHNSTASNWKRNCKPNVRAPLWHKRIWHIYNIADKNPQYHIEVHSTVSWENLQTNVTRMSVVTTLWVSLTKYKTIITFIMNSSDRLPWLSTDFISPPTASIPNSTEDFCKAPKWPNAMDSKPWKPKTAKRQRTGTQITAPHKLHAVCKYISREKKPKRRRRRATYFHLQPHWFYEAARMLMKQKRVSSASIIPPPPPPPQTSWATNSHS